MKANEREIHNKMILGLQAIKEEVQALTEGYDRPKWWNGAHPDCQAWMSVMQWYEYIVDDATTEKKFHNGIRDKGRSGMFLSDFCEHPIAVECGLREEHIVALRLYTTHAYMFFNDPLRKNERHPMPVTVRFLQEGLKKLRKHTSKQGGELPRFLFRGMSNMIINDDEENAFLKDGGTEVAPMSTSTKFEVAAQYSCNKGQEGESSLIMKLRIPTNGFTQ